MPIYSVGRLISLLGCYHLEFLFLHSFCFHSSSTLHFICFYLFFCDPLFPSQEPLLTVKTRVVFFLYGVPCFLRRNTYGWYPSLLLIWNIVLHSSDLGSRKILGKSLEKQLPMFKLLVGISVSGSPETSGRHHAREDFSGVLSWPAF